MLYEGWLQWWLASRSSQQVLIRPRQGDAHALHLEAKAAEQLQVDHVEARADGAVDGRLHVLDVRCRQHSTRRRSGKPSNLRRCGDTQ
jgi:hypothetical protein